MIVEGKGVVPPKPIRCRIRSDEVRILARTAWDRANRRQYRGGNIWRQGMLGPLSIPGVGTLQPHMSPIYVGLLGEYVLAKHLESKTGDDIPVDLEFRETGDDGSDVVARGFRVQVKTRTKTEPATLVRAADRQGVAILHPCDAFAICRVGTELRDGLRSIVDPASCWILGWIRHREVVSPDRIRFNARWGGTNYRVQDDELLPTSRLVDEILWRRAG